MFQNGLGSLARLGYGRSMRSSSWDRSGGNRDNVAVGPGETRRIAEIEGPGCITHIWMTVAHPDIYWARTIVIRAYFDGAASPCIEAPLGDFFGIGNCRSAPYWSVAFSTAPVGGRGLNCFLPMPFGEGAQIEIENQPERIPPASPGGKEALEAATRLIRSVYSEVEKEEEGSSAQLSQFARLALIVREIESKILESDWAGLSKFIESLS